MKMNTSKHGWYFLCGMLMLVSFCFWSCKDDDDEGGGYDPNKPVVITDFSPKNVGLGSNLIVYGDNFGTDISRIKVQIGGQVARVIKVVDKALYCIVPSKAYDGDIQISIIGDDGEELAYAVAEEKVEYQKKWVVTTAIGTYYEIGSLYEEMEGPFDNCGAFKDLLWLTFDPKKPDHLYAAADNNTNAGACRMFDFGNQYTSYFATPGLGRKGAIAWTADENCDMIVPDNHSSDTKVAIHVFTRASGFTQKETVDLNVRGLNGTLVHPDDGALYYSRFRAGDIRKYNFKTKTDELVFRNPYSGVAVYMVLHPTGDYMYLIEHDKHYIMRSDYDYENHTFKDPYLVCGNPGTADYAEGVGSNAKFRKPRQGVFVKNPEYEENGGDQYDFYVCDQENHAIRKVTPQGRVSTFAGRGNNGTSGYANGDLRLEARFNNPKGIAYDEQNNCFYIADAGNWLIRKIAKEE